MGGEGKEEKQGLGSRQRLPAVEWVGEGCALYAHSVLYTHTHTHTHTHAHMHTLSHTRSLARSLPRARARASTHAHLASRHGQAQQEAAALRREREGRAHSHLEQ